MSNINIQNNPNSDPRKMNGSTLTSEVSLSGVDPNQPFNHKDYFDENNFPESTGFGVLPWTDFTVDFKGLDK